MRDKSGLEYGDIRCAECRRDVDEFTAIVRIEFDSAEEARSFVEKVGGSDVLANLSPIVPPTVIELAEQTSY